MFCGFAEYIDRLADALEPFIMVDMDRYSNPDTMEEAESITAKTIVRMLATGLGELTCSNECTCAECVHENCNNAIYDMVRKTDGQDDESLNILIDQFETFKPIPDEGCRKKTQN